ncbi:hypothetical protein NCS52_01029700 [Fusarium sp. LHS14.1]|nr:hypothetical protein NCS52_01029700 [Fusarium sp. LHS14.1]
MHISGEFAALKELSPHILGLDPRSPAQVVAVMDGILMSGTAAKSIVDIACWDILGKAVGLPTSVLLGGSLTEELRAFSVVGLSDTATGVEKARAEVEKGAKAMQVKIGDDPLSDARRVTAIVYLFILLSCVVAVSAQDYGYATCWNKLDAIMVGNMTKGGIDNETVLDYLWNGAIAGFRGENRPIALGYEGCLKICEGRTDRVTTRSTLEMVTTWIFPLAIVFNLPYDSLHHQKIRRTAQAVLNWAGSPQMALTHTIWNREVLHSPRLGTFITAFIFSIVLAFDEEAGNRTGSPLTLGLLYCWLPLLVIFTIIDRNPVSADRSAALMSRWLFNVDAVLASARAAGANLTDMPAPVWWSRSVDQDDDLGEFRIQEFIGQGRKIKYCGLADAVIRAQNAHTLRRDLDQYRLCAQTVLTHLDSRPIQWWLTALASLFLVVFEIMMAFLIAYCTPTFGLGCWSGGLLLYGALSTVTWGIHLIFKAPGKWVQIVCNCFNFLALGWIVTLTGFVLAGGFRTCWCSTVKLSSGGYMMFESFDYYVENFAMSGPWISASVLGGLVPGAVLVTATAWWMNYQHLWSTEENKPVQDVALGNGKFRADTSWLRA